MAEESAISLEETNKIRVSLGLKPIPVNSSTNIVPSNVTNQAKEPSIEETNRIRSSLDTRPSADSSSEPGVRSSSSGISTYHRKQFIEDSLLKLRKRTQQISPQTQTQTLLSKDDKGDDWLSSIGNSKKKNKVALSKNYDEEEEQFKANGPTFKVSHDLSTLEIGKDVILTLNEKDIGAEQEDGEEDEDILINENITHEAEDARNIKLKQMAKDRKRKKIGFGRALEDTLGEDQENGDLFFRIGTSGEVVESVSRNLEKGDADIHKGKRKVSFQSPDEDNSDAQGDYVPVKIKKRKRKNDAVKQKRVKVPTQALKVDLVNEDNLEEDDDELQGFLNATRGKKLYEQTKLSAEDIAIEVEREKREKEQRASDIARIDSNSGLTIDENTAFLESLKSNLISGDDEQKKFEKINLKEVVAKQRLDIMNQSDDGEESEQKNDNGPNFYEGLGSTLSFLKKLDVIPKTSQAIAPSVGTREDDLLKLQQQIEARKIKEKVAQELQKSNVEYTKEEMEKVRGYEEKEIAKKTREFQRKRLANYNPEVRLTYKDNAGNELTTKEAYKKLSQAFHGTKSNKKKQVKAQERIKERRKKYERDFYIGLE